jgi:hypothetical protein
MSNQVIQDLKSSDPARRRAAIISLADSPDPNAPAWLTRVAQTDPDPKLRDLAAKAQRHAEKKRWQNAAQPSAIPASEPEPAAPSWAQNIDRINANLNDDAAIAQGQLNNAFGSFNNGDIAGAREALRNAIQFDPNLAYNPEVQQLAASLTGQPYDTAVAAFVPTQGKGGSANPGGPRPFSSILLSLVGECFLIFILVAAPIAGISSITKFALDKLSASGRSTANMAEMQATLSRTDPVTLGLSAGAAVVFTELVWVFLMYFGGLLLGGTGTIFEFAEAILGVNIVGTLACFGTVVVFALIPRNALGQNSASIFSWVWGLVNLGWSCALVYYAARKHEFDLGRGCLTVMSPALLSCLCLFGLAILSPFARTH